MSGSTVPDVSTSMRDLHWSPREKAVARRAFDHALHRELEGTIQEAKGRAAKVKEPSDLWDLEQWLTRRRKEIDDKYDYRYSVLPFVFAVLIREGGVSLEDLRELGEDKLDFIRGILRL